MVREWVKARRWPSRVGRRRVVDRCCRDYLSPESRLRPAILSRGGIASGPRKD